MKLLLKAAVAAGLVGLVAASVPGRPSATIQPVSPARFNGALSVLTFNIKGLPWPVASGRSAALSAITQRLASMRATGVAPQIAVLQETFTADAQAIGAAAGYRFIANGPDADTIVQGTDGANDRAFARGARWWRGETEGKFVGSGLQILSDYPIVAIRKRAFPAYACAGFDCLANKGALLVTAAIPGTGLIDVLTTHLNSRHASRASDARSLYAYDRQVSDLSRFVRDTHDPRLPLIAAGDFNVGSAPARRLTLLTQARRWSSTPVADAFDSYRAQGGVLDGDAALSYRRARDWQFFASGTETRLTLADIATPFGHDETGRMLSDHVGYVATFQLERLGRNARSDLTMPARSRL